MSYNPYNGLTSSLASVREAGRQSNSFAGQSMNHEKRRRMELEAAAKKKIAPAPARPATNSSPSIRSVEGRNGALEASLGLGANPETTAPVGNNNPGGGNSGGGSPGPDLAAIAKAMMDEKYSGIQGSIETGRDANKNAYQEAQDKMKAFYGKAAEARKEPFAAGVTELSDNLKNLGMDFSSTDTAKDWDKNERNLQENADLALANDQSWFEKMKTTNADLYNSMLVELAQTRMAEEMMAASGGGGSGGGGRGGGGRGGSSSSGENTLTGDTTADENFLVENPGVIEALNGMSPNTAARYSNQYDRNSGDVDSVLKEIAGQQVLADRYGRRNEPLKVSSNPIKTALSAFRSTAGAVGRRSQKTLANDTNFWRSVSSKHGPVQTNSKINVTSKNASPKTRIPQ